MTVEHRHLNISRSDRRHGDAGIGKAGLSAFTFSLSAN
jgi:hypothetical protein